MSTPSHAPSVGDRCPDFLLPPEDGMTETFYARHAGHPMALIVAHDAGRLAAFGAVSGTRTVLGLVPGIEPRTVDAAIPAMHAPAALVAMLGLHDDAAGPVAWVLDTTLRLRHRLDDADPSQVRDALHTLSAASQDTPPSVCTSAAPVLMLPGVLNAALCRQLIAAHAADHHASGMLRQVGGPAHEQVVLTPDARIKRRTDHTLTEPGLVEAVMQALSRRVLPEIAAAFHYPVTRLEGFKLVAYDAADAGCFRPHRDNGTPDARHRRFALTLALDDGYDGGCLRFPEHGPTLYRPPAGGAIVFSGSLLHEVTEVTRGRRHALLTFLWGDEAGR